MTADRTSTRFELRRKLGAGGMGIVYEAHDSERDAVVALKVLREKDPAALLRFKREFRELATLVHPNLINLYELHSTGEEWFFTMELIDGSDFLGYVRPRVEDGTLVQGAQASGDATQADHVKLATSGPSVVFGTRSAAAGSRFVEERLRRVLDGVASALDAIHERGLLHRDVKSSNVLVRRDGRAVLCDFGLVKDVVRSPSLTETHAILGTPQYMSPEQATGEPLGSASDWYSVGVMLYEALTGRLPFLGSGADHINRKVASVPPLAPIELDPAVPADLSRLCSALLSRDPAKRPTYREIREHVAPASPARPSRRPLLQPDFQGRAAELASLREAFGAVSPDSASVVFVNGPSGMGKTALVRAYLEELGARSDVVLLAGRCYERESVPFNGIDSVMDALTAHLGQLGPSALAALLPEGAGLLGRVFPVLKALDAVMDSIGTFIDPLEARRHALAALKEILRRIGANKKVVLFVDDLQWADVETASALVELTRAPSPPLFLVATHRDRAAPSVRALSRRPEDGGFACRTCEIQLGPLSDLDARRIAGRILEQNGLGGIELDQLVREAKGSPFFLQELTRHAQRTADSDEVSGPSLHGLLASRLGALPEPARRMLEYVAVAAHPVPQSIIRIAAELGRDEATALNILRSEHLVRTGGVRGADDIEVIHDHVRIQVTGELTPAERQGRHRKLARALIAAGSSDALALLEHFRGAGDAVSAATYAMTAGDQAYAALGFERASDHYRLALELKTWSAQEERVARAKLGDALANAGRGAEAAASYLRASEGEEDVSRALDLRRRAAEQLLRAGQIDDGMRVLETVFTALNLRIARSPLGAIVSLLLHRALLAIRGLGYRERQRSAIPARELMRLDCWSSVTTGLSLVNPISGSDFHTRQFLLALRAGEPNRLARSIAIEIGYQALSGRRATAKRDRLIAMGRALAERLQSPLAEGLIHATTGLAFYLEQRWERALESSLRAEQILRERCTGVTWEIDTAQRVQVICLFYSGDIPQLRERVLRLVREADERGDLYASCGLRAYHANVAWLAMDDLEGARREIEHVRARWTQSGYHLQHHYIFVARVQAALYAGERAEAFAHVEKEWGALSRSLLMRIQLLRVESLALRARAALAAHQQTGDAALLAIAQRDAARIRREETEWAVGMSHAIDAAVAHARRDDASARALLGLAITDFDRSETRLYAAAARCALAGLAGGDGGAAEEGLRFLRGRGVVEPDKLVAMLLPGFTRRATEVGSP